VHEQAGSQGPLLRPRLFAIRVLPFFDAGNLQFSVDRQKKSYGCVGQVVSEA
jgi:hypothetical protein